MATEQGPITRIVLTRAVTPEREGWTVALEATGGAGGPAAVPIVFGSLVAALSAITETVAVEKPPSPSVVINGLRLDGHLRSALDYAVSSALQKLKNQLGLANHLTELHDDLRCLSEMLRVRPTERTRVSPAGAAGRT